MLFLRAHFISFAWVGEGAYIVYEIRRADTGTALIHLGRVLVQTLLFHYGLKLRASICHLPDKDLDNFLFETLFKGGFKTLSSVLFTLFRSLKCVIESDIESCIINTSCASYICGMLILVWGLKLVQGSIKSEWRKELSISMEKVARMTISWGQAAEGLLLALMAGCGAFLFALMDAKGPGKDLVTGLGLVGGVAGVACIVSQIYMVTKERKRLLRRWKGRLEQPGTAPREELVECCSWWYVAACVVGSTSFTIVQVVSAITLADWSLRAGFLLLAIAGMCMGLGGFLRPTDQGAGLKILHLQFFFFAIGSELAKATGRFRQGVGFEGWASLARIPFWFAVYWLSLNLRKKAAQLLPVELSNFLCHVVLVGGVSAMAPMVFFIFEAASCMASGDGLGDDQCDNTAMAAKFLSVYLGIIAAVSMASRTVQQEERGEGMTCSNLAILRLKMKERVQGALGVVTALVSMYLFSVLGVEGAPDESIRLLGLAGGVTLLLAGLIEFASLASLACGANISTGDGRAGSSSGSVGRPSNVSAEEDQLSLRDVAENMTIIDIV